MKMSIFHSQLRAVHTAGLALIFALTAGLTPPAFAHAVLQKSTPAANSTIAGTGDAGLPIMLTFNSRIDAAHSVLMLVAAPSAKPLPLTIDKKAEPNVLKSIAAGLKPGHYQLQWQVVASDGHISRGVVPFDVR